MRRFTRKIFVAVLAVVGGYFAAQAVGPATSLLSDASPTPPPRAGAPAKSVEPIRLAEGSASGDGQRLVRNVLEHLELRPNLVAKVRQSMRVGKGRFTGEGDYWQRGVGNLRKTRWELKTLLGSDEAFVTQICDGDYVWTDCRLPGERQITRIEIARVRLELATALPAASEAEQGRAANVPVPPELLVHGGVTQLMAELSRTFTFGPEQTLRRGDRTVQAVIGRWRREPLEREWPGISQSDAENWPPHLPHHVLLYVDNDDLFPYLVEYRGGAQAALATSTAAYFPAQDPLASFEFIDVQANVAIADSQFQFAPAEHPWHDITAGLIERLRPPPPPPKPDDTATARRAGSWR